VGPDRICQLQQSVKMFDLHDRACLPEAPFSVPLFIVIFF